MNIKIKNKGGCLQLWVQELNFHLQFFRLKLVFLLQPLYQEQDFQILLLDSQQPLPLSALYNIIQKERERTYMSYEYLVDMINNLVCDHNRQY